MNKLLTYFYCASLLCCVEVNATENSPISYVPQTEMRHILSFVQEDDNKNLRLASKGMKQNVEDCFKATLKTQFRNYTVNGNAFPIKDVFIKDSPGPFLAPFKSHYTNRIMKEVCAEYLKDDGYLFVSQGSLLEDYLGRHCKSLPFYDYLQNKKEETKDLFKAFFGKDLPEGKELLGLKLLTACLPSNHIYVDENTTEVEYSELMKKFQERLLQSIQGHKRKYFLCGIDEESTLSEEDVIVINQSDVDFGFISRLDNSSIRRTIIYNADQEELSFYNPPKSMSNLILVNGDNRCVRIGNDFLHRHEGLQSCDLKGLTSVQTIGDRFLYCCKNLVTFDTNGMTGVETIGNSFLSGCENLITFDSKGLTSVQTIGNSFLSSCKNLVTFDSQGMTSVKRIGANFLFGCKKLVTFDSNGMTSVEKIGDYFLSCCYNLVTFDTKSMTSVKKIGDKFLFGCDNLVKFDTEGLTSVQTIGDDFLSNCENLVTFDSKGMTRVETIGEYFLSRCKNLITFDANGMIRVETIEKFFLSGCKNLITFYSNGMRNVRKIEECFLSGCEKLHTLDTEKLTNVHTIGKYFLNGCPKLNGNKIKEEILKKKF